MTIAQQKRIVKGNEPLLLDDPRRFGWLNRVLWYCMAS
jgi:hypothetical protein